MKVLLNPDGTEGGGGTDSSSQQSSVSAQAPLSTPSSDQISTFKGSPATPVSKAPPMPADLKGKVFDITGEADMEYDNNKEASASSDFQKPAESKKEEVKVEQQEEKKPEAPKGIKAGLPEKTIPGQKEIPKDPTLTGRDYSIFPEEMRDDLKKTGNNAFKHISKLYNDHKKLQEEHTKIKPEYEKLQQGGFPAQWYTHPEAWKLHPQAVQQSRTIQKVEFEEGFWYEQLQRIQEGEKYQLLRGYNKDGNPVYSEEIEPSKQAETQLLLTVGKLQSDKQRLYVGLNNFAQNFQQQFKAQEQAIEGVIDEQWPWHKDEKHPAQKWVKEFLDIIPQERRDDYMSKVASLLYASFSKAQELLAERFEENKGLEHKQEVQRHVEPKLSSPSAASAMSGANSRVNIGNRNGVPKVFNLENME